MGTISHYHKRTQGPFVCLRDLELLQEQVKEEAVAELNAEMGWIKRHLDFRKEAVLEWSWQWQKKLG